MTGKSKPSKEAFFYSQRRNKNKGQPKNGVPQEQIEKKAVVAEADSHEDVEMRRIRDFGFTSSLDFDAANDRVRDDSTPWTGAHVQPYGKINAIPFVRLSEGTDLQVPPPHYLRVDEVHNIHRHAPGYKYDTVQGLASLLEAGIADLGNSDKAINIVTCDAVLQAIVDSFALDSPLLLWVYRMGPLILIDTDDRSGTLSTPSRHHEKALFAKFLYRMSEVVAVAGESNLLEQAATRTNTERGPAFSTALVSPGDGSVPRLGTLATASIDGGNSWESSQTFTNVVKWTLPGDLNILLGVDRPIFTVRQRVFPVMLSEEAVSDDPRRCDSTTHRQALHAWVSSLLSASPTVEVCRVSEGRVRAHQTVNASELLKECGQGWPAMNFATLVLRWLQSQCTSQGGRYLVARRANARTLDVQQVDAMIVNRRSHDGASRSDEYLRQYRRENCWAIMSLKMARKLYEGGMRLDHATDLLVTSSKWFALAAIDSHISQLSSVRQEGEHQALQRRAAAAWNAHTQALDAVVGQLGAVALNLLRLEGQEHLSSALKACQNIGKNFVDLLNYLQATRRDLPFFATEAPNSAAAGVAAASDSLWFHAAKMARRWVITVAKLCLRCVIRSLEMIAANSSVDTSPTASIAAVAICVAEEALVALKESTAAETATLRVSTESSALSAPLVDNDTVEAARSLQCALKEHCVDVLITCLGWHRLDHCTQMHSAVTDFASRWPVANRSDQTRPFSQLLRDFTATTCDAATVGYKCLSWLTSCGAAPRIAVKSARCHLFAGHASRKAQRYTKALDALAIAMDMIKVVSFGDDEGSDTMPVTVETDESAKHLRVQIQLEMGLLHRERARVEHSLANSFTDATLRAWDKAINCLREEWSVSGHAAAGTMLGAFMLELVDTSTLTPGGSKASVWYSDLLEKLQQAEKLLSVASMEPLRLRVLTRALNDCVYTGNMEGTSVAAVLATRQHWASVGWATMCSGTRQAKSPQPAVDLHITLQTDCEKEVVLFHATYSPVETLSTKLEFMHAMCEWNLTAEVDSRVAVALPSRRRLVAEALDAFLALESAPHDAGLWRQLLALLLAVTKKVGSGPPSPIQEPLRNCVGVITGCGYGGAQPLNPNHATTCRNALLSLRRAVDASTSRA